MSTQNTSNDPVITRYAQAPARTVTAGGVTYAYRELGPKGGIPIVFFVHLAATLDNWDPAIIDPIAENRHVITFDNRGVGASSGDAPDTVEAMADDAYAFITALGYSTIDVFSFSLGGMVAQALVVKHPDLVRKIVLTGTGPKGGKGIDKVAGVTYLDMLRAALTRSDPKEFLFFNRDAAGKPAARAFVSRLVINYREDEFKTVLHGCDVVLHSLDNKTLKKSLLVLKPGGKLISISGPPDPAFASEMGMPWILRQVTRAMSHRIRKAAKRRQVSYSFLFMQANGDQLRQITSLIDSGFIEPVIDRVFPFESTNEAMRYVEKGRVKGNVVVKVK